jgi:glycolate oxidase
MARRPSERDGARGGTTRGVSSVDPLRCVRALEMSLGDSKVNADPAHREAYATDESEAAWVAPIAVVHARTVEDVSRTLRTCCEHGVPVVPRAAGTGRTGGATVVVPSVTLDTTGMSALRELSREDGLAIVEPGVITGHFHARCEAEGLFYPPDPQSSAWCTLGGNVAENAGGPRALKYGVTREYLLGMQAVTMDGTVLSIGRRTVKGVTGYDLTGLLCGSEGTLAVFTELWLKVVPDPGPARSMLAIFGDVQTAGRAVAGVLGAGIVPRCLELLDEACCDAVRAQAPSALPPDARAILLLEFDGDPGASERACERAGDALDQAGAAAVLLAQHGGDRERLWTARSVLSRALRAQAKHKLSEDIVVPRSRIGALLDTVRALSEREGIRMPTYGHAGDGNLHVNLLWDDPSARPGVDRAIRALFERVVSLGGTLSGEHGIGVLKREHLPLEQSDGLLEAQRAIKRALDPRGLLNPHKVLPAPAGHRAC